MSSQEAQSNGEATRTARAKRGTPRDMSFKVSEKGGVSVYGLGRFPVTLYREQWLKLLDRAGEIRQFVIDNEELLKRKD